MQALGTFHGLLAPHELALGTKGPTEQQSVHPGVARGSTCPAPPAGVGSAWLAPLLLQLLSCLSGGSTVSRRAERRSAGHRSAERSSPATY